MKVYFSASSSTLKEDKNLYKNITETISKLGGVLISDWMVDKTRLSPESLFDQAVKDIRQADLLVAEITHPSTGVGQQIGLALSWKIPVIALKRGGLKNNSRFTLGTKSKLLKIVIYDADTLENKLKKYFNGIKKYKYVKFNFITTRDIYDYIDGKSRAEGISMSEFLRNIVEEYRFSKQ